MHVIISNHPEKTESSNINKEESTYDDNHAILDS